MKTSHEFNVQFVKFFSGLTDKVEANFASYNCAAFDDEGIAAIKGRKYIKIVMTKAGEPRSVHCFIDMTNGNVLKAEGYSKPAKHARGNIYNDDAGLNAVSAYGANYLR